MKICVKSLSPLVLLATLTYTGCAKQEVVRKDSPIAPALSSARKDTSGTAVKPVDTTARSAVQTPPPPATTAPAPEQPAAAQGGAPAAVAAEVQRQLEKVYFDFDSATLSEAARHALTGDAALITRNPGVKVRIEGHCDERGSDEYNLAIGERRARAAARYLESLGVGAERITTLSFGKEKPAAPGHDEAAWAQNRRDELIALPGR